jgi:Protein of unknown function (DUF3093)
VRAYSERLSVPVTWWFLSAVSIAMLGAELWAGFGALAALATYAALGLTCGATLVHWGAVHVRVTDTGLLAAGRQLPRSAIGEVMALDERQARELRGPRADPAAHMLIRPYLKRAVYIEVTDPGAAEPYWLIGTRHPAQLAAALGGAPAHPPSAGASRPEQ